jgi:DNA-binding transcriptional ArsR family regulator
MRVYTIHVLINPEHHLERIAWAKNMRNKLPEAFCGELVHLGKITRDWCVIMDLCNVHDECNDFNIMSGLDFIDDLSVGDFNLVFQKYNDLKEMHFDEAFKKRVIRALKEYYLIYFEKELRFIEPLLIRFLKRDSEVCIRKGILNYVNELHSRIEVTDKAFLFHKYTLFTIPFDTLKRVIIRVSSFISPHLLMDYADDMVQFTTVAHLDTKIEKVPMDLLKLIKALSDETRLKIIRQLRKSKGSTQSLAAELNITEAGISKHLKMLYDAELLYKEREGNYIYYYLNTFFIDRIPLELYEFLDS